MDILSFVIVGHVDHGKSTLIGRLLYDTGSLASDRMDEIQKASARHGRQTEFAYLLDHFEEERSQGITIDTTQVFFKTPRRCYTIIDAPGHVEFIRNMITGASHAQAAVVIVDVSEGIREQTRRHSYLLSLLGLKRVIVVVNKMDLVDYSTERFRAVERDMKAWLRSVDIVPHNCVPISAAAGDNVAMRSGNMAWYCGPTFIESLDALTDVAPTQDRPLLMPVQDVYTIDGRRISVGRIESGTIAEGDEVKVLPDGDVTKVLSVEKFLEDKKEAFAGECIGLTTAGSVRPERGDVLCLPGREPILTDRIPASIFWMSEKGFTKDQRLALRCATQQVECRIESISKRIDSSTLEIIEQDATSGGHLDVAEVTIKTERPVVVKSFNDVQELGRFVLVDDDNICAGGIVTAAS